MDTDLIQIEKLITAQKSTCRSNFAISFLFMPSDRRQGIQTIYTFARLADDMVDNDAWSIDQKRRALAIFESILNNFLKTGNYQEELPKQLALFFRQLKTVQSRFGIALTHFSELLQGCRMDLDKTYYNTFEELKNYCYHVASSVGLMCLPIFGYESRFEGMKFAINLGLSFQLINIVRDIEEDWNRNRVYLAREDMLKHGINPDRLLSDPHLSDLILDYASRARELHQKAFETVSRKDALGPLFPATLMAAVYLRLLAKIERNPTIKRASLGLIEKFSAIRHPLMSKIKDGLWTSRTKKFL